jgi:hypothetical protein
MNMKPVTDREGFIRRGWLIPALRQAGQTIPSEPRDRWFQRWFLKNPTKVFIMQQRFLSLRRHLAKVRVISSNLIARSIKSPCKSTVLHASGAGEQTFSLRTMSLVCAGTSDEPMVPSWCPPHRGVHACSNRTHYALRIEEG